MQSITPFLWFDGQAQKAAQFYVSIFKKRDSKIHSSDEMSVRFRLLGQEFIALNGGPHFKFNPAVSFFVSCTTQKEVDTLWEKLSAGGGKKGRCGWLTDKFGLSWQVIPTVLGELMADNDEAKAARVMQAMLKMKKIDIQKLKKAYVGK